jgi:hypothetical protein
MSKLFAPIGRPVRSGHALMAPYTASNGRFEREYINGAQYGFELCS